MIGVIWFICSIIVYGFELIGIILILATIYCMANKINGVNIINKLIR